MLVVVASVVVGSSETSVDEGVSVDDSVVVELTLTVVDVAGKVTTIVTLDSVVVLDVASGNGESGILNDEEVLDVVAVTLSVRQHFQLRAILSKPILPRLS